MGITRKNLFHIPKEIIYLDGNSLGPLPQSVKNRVSEMIECEWGNQLIGGWNDANWFNLPTIIGNQIARLIGAPNGTVVVGDTLSIKVFQALASALEMKPNKKIILSDSGNFPTDLYMAEGLIKLLNNGYELRVVAPNDIENSIDHSIAVMMITEVDYRTGYKHNVKELTKKAHKEGAMSVIDLAHSTGALVVDVIDSNCDFAIGCTYKYLNGGPGSPAFIYIRKDLIDKASSSLSGWMGHNSPFSFEKKYKAALSIEKMRVGTPAIIQMVCLQEALKVFDGVDMKKLRKKSIELSELFIKEVEARCDELKLISPRKAKNRGSQISFIFKYGYETIQALIERGVIGDFRAPNVMRFGFTPLYIDEADVLEAAKKIENVIKNKLYENKKYIKSNQVT